MLKVFSKDKKSLVPGTLVECKSGRFLAFYEHRSDIVANGNNERDAKKNLKVLYNLVIEFERNNPDKAKKPDDEPLLPLGSKTTPFREKILVS